MLKKELDITRLYTALTELEPVSDEKTDWLNFDNPTKAFVTVAGAGPWKVNRRAKVQANARLIAGNRDLVELSDDEITSMYPFWWQQRILLVTKQNCLAADKSFSDEINDIQKRLPDNQLLAWDMYRELLGGKITKATSLFARDYLYINCFPIDRHVKRWLQEQRLDGCSEEYIISLGIRLKQQYNFDIRCYARAIFLNKSSNPTKSIDQTNETQKFVIKPNGEIFVEWVNPAFSDVLLELYPEEEKQRMIDMNWPSEPKIYCG